MGSNPARDALALILTLIQDNDPQKGTCLTKNASKSQQQQQASVLGYQCKEFEVMTLQDALIAYKTYARAEGKSPKTIRWTTSSVGYFAEFLGSEHQDIASITGNDCTNSSLPFKANTSLASTLIISPSKPNYH